MLNRPYANPLNGQPAEGARVRRFTRTLDTAAKWSIFSVPCGSYVKMHDRRPEEEAS
jgi:hypothetical protein